MIVASKNKRTQLLFTRDLGTGAGDIIFVGAVSTVIDNLISVSMSEILVVGDNALNYTILPDLESSVELQINIDSPSTKGD